MLLCSTRCRVGEVSATLSVAGSVERYCSAPGDEPVAKPQWRRPLLFKLAKVKRRRSRKLFLGQLGCEFCLAAHFDLVDRYRYEFLP
jgi:hypothetical protein